MLSSNGLGPPPPPPPPFGPASPLIFANGEETNGTIEKEEDVLPKLPLRLAVANVSATSRQNEGRVSGLAVCGSRMMVAGQDARILSFEPLPNGPLEFTPPELRAGAAISDFCAIPHAQDRSRIVAVAGSDTDGDLRVWVIVKALGGGSATANKMSGHSNAVTSVDVLNEFILSGSLDQTVRLWDIDGQSQILCLGHSTPVTQTVFMPGSAEILTASTDCILRVFDMKSSTITRPTFLMQGHEDVAAIQVATAQGGLVASADENGKVLLFDIHRTGARRLATVTVPSGVSALQFIMNGKYLLCSGLNGSLKALRLSDFSTGELNVQPQPPPAFPEIQAGESGTSPPEQKAPPPPKLIHRLKGAMWRSRHILAWAFDEGGWGFGILSEDEPEPHVAAGSNVDPDSALID